MRKVHKNQDGSEEILEGDPEELRKYEDLQRPVQEEQAPITEAPKKPGILHGAEVDGVPLTEAEVEWIRVLRKLTEQRDNTGLIPDFKPYQPYGVKPWPWPQGPIWIAPCSMCGRDNCGGACYLRFTQPLITLGTVTTTGIKLDERPKH